MLINPLTAVLVADRSKRPPMIRTVHSPNPPRPLPAMKAIMSSVCASRGGASVTMARAVPLKQPLVGMGLIALGFRQANVTAWISLNDVFFVITQTEIMERVHRAERRRDRVIREEQQRPDHPQEPAVMPGGRVDAAAIRIDAANLRIGPPNRHDDG